MVTTFYMAKVSFYPQEHSWRVCQPVTCVPTGMDKAWGWGGGFLVSQNLCSSLVFPLAVPSWPPLPSASPTHISLGLLVSRRLSQTESARVEGESGHAGEGEGGDDCGGKRGSHSRRNAAENHRFA